MDKKEFLKRWMLAYIEPRLFYIPWKKQADGSLLIQNTTFYAYPCEVIGGIFDENNNLVLKVSFTDNYFTRISLKAGVYTYKEAVSPLGYELSENIIFEIKSKQTTPVYVRHKSRQTYFKRSFEKYPNDIYTPIIPTESPYNEHEIEIYDYYNYVLRQYNADGDLLRTIYDIRNKNMIRHSESNSNLGGNYISRHDYFFKGIRLYNWGDKNYYNRVEFDFTPDEDIIWTTSTPKWNTNWSNEPSVTQSWKMNKLHITFVQQDKMDTERGIWISSLTKEQILSIYRDTVQSQDIPLNVITERYCYSYSVWVYDGKYYTNGADCNYDGFTISFALRYGERKLTYGYPRDVLLSEESISPDNFVVKNHVSNLSKYLSDGVISTGGYEEEILDIFPKNSFINQEILDIINNSESGGEV